MGRQKDAAVKFVSHTNIQLVYYFDVSKRELKYRKKSFSARHLHFLKSDLAGERNWCEGSHSICVLQ